MADSQRAQAAMDGMGWAGLHSKKKHSGCVCAHHASRVVGVKEIKDSDSKKGPARSDTLHKKLLV